MTDQEALEILEAMSNIIFNYCSPDRYNALKRGIEALAEKIAREKGRLK